MIVYLYTHGNQNSDEQHSMLLRSTQSRFASVETRSVQITSEFHVERRYNCIDSEPVISFSILSACRYYRLVTTTGLVKVFPRHVRAHRGAEEVPFARARQQRSTQHREETNKRG